MQQFFIFLGIISVGMLIITLGLVIGQYIDEFIKKIIKKYFK